MNVNSHPQPIRWSNRYYQKLCASPFVIWFRERSGSTFLCSMLKSHPDIFCRYEDFDLFWAEDQPEAANFKKPLTFNRRPYYRRVKEFKGFVDHPDEQRAIGHLRQLYSRPNPACGFKFKFEIQVAGYPEIVDELHWISPMLRVLFLTRRNVLKQAVSRQNMERLKFQSNHGANLRSTTSLPPLSLDIPRALRYARYLTAQDGRFEKSVSRFDHVKTICYEELQADPQRIMTEVLEFLNVNTSHQLTSSFLKSTPDRLDTAVANYDELVSAVSGTELESMLD